MVMMGMQQMMHQDVQNHQVGHPAHEHEKLVVHVKNTVHKNLPRFVQNNYYNNPIIRQKNRKSKQKGAVYTFLTNIPTRRRNVWEDRTDLSVSDCADILRVGRRNGVSAALPFAFKCMEVCGLWQTESAVINRRRYAQTRAADSHRNQSNEYAGLASPVGIRYTIPIGAGPSRANFR